MGDESVRVRQHGDGDVGKRINADAFRQVKDFNNCRTAAGFIQFAEYIMNNGRPFATGQGDGIDR